MVTVYSQGIMVWVKGVACLKCFYCEKVKNGPDGIEISGLARDNNLCKACHTEGNLGRTRITEYFDTVMSLDYSRVSNLS